MKERYWLQSLLPFFILLLFTPMHVFAQQTPAALEGAWEGNLVLPNGQLRIVFNLKAEGDGLSATMDSPDQGATGIPVTSTTLEAGILTLNASAIRGTYKGTVNEAGDAIAGTWSQGGMSLELNLSKTEKPTKVDRPQEPQRPFPYEEEAVFYDNAVGDARLAGTLTLPTSPGPHPAVVLISGSGPQDRDETIMGHKPFLVLSDHLTREGIAVLRYDDRGTGESTGNFAAATSEDLARDAQAAVDFLKTRSDIDASQIGLAGHSEGGLIAPMLAQKPDNVAFIVLLAGPGLTGAEILKQQTNLIAKAAGMSDALVEKLVATNTTLYAVAQSASSDTVAEELKAAVSRIKTELGPNTAGALGMGNEAAEQRIVAQLSSPWMRYFLSYDPAPALTKVKVPVLSIIGSKDLQVPAAGNTAAIQQALQAGNNPHFVAKVLPDLNHLFQTAETGAVAEYGQITETFAPEALDMVGNWIKEQVQ
ncbi:MAG: alpha/beta hydrolase [Bacteroidota bacterium]